MSFGRFRLRHLRPARPARRGLPTRAAASRRITRIAGPASGPFFLDTFADAETPLEDHTPDVGQGWAKQSGDMVTIDGGAAAIQPGDFGIYATDGTAPEDYAVTAVIDRSGASAAALGDFALYARLDGPDGYYTFYDGGTTWTLVRLPGTIIAQANAPFHDDPLTLALVVGPGTQKVIANGITVLSATDATFTAGVPGFQLGSEFLRTERFEATELSVVKRRGHPSRATSRRRITTATGATRRTLVRPA